jgi:hypothetical protein
LATISSGLCPFFAISVLLRLEAIPRDGPLQRGRITLVESDVSRWKRVIGGGLRSRTDGRQATEVAIAADVLNRMLDLGRPEYVRIA